MPDAVTPSKKHFPALAKHYGILSNSFVHETFSSVGRSVGKPKGIFIVPKLHEKLQTPQIVLLELIGILAFDVGQITEWALHGYFSEFRYWEKTSETQLKAISCPASRAVEKLTKKLEEALAETTSQDQLVAD